MANKRVYRVSFINQGQIYEVYVRQVAQSGMHGFVELEGMIFGEKSALVIDPAEERLKAEFAGVKRSYVPMHAVIRIDEVEREGTAKIVAFDGRGQDISSAAGAYTPPVAPGN